MAENYSLGEAIGLNYSIPNANVAVGMIEQRRREDMAAEEAARKRAQKSRELQDKNKAEMNKLLMSEKGGIIPNLQPDVKAHGVEALKVYQKNSAANPENYNIENDDELHFRSKTIFFLFQRCQKPSLL